MISTKIQINKILDLINVNLRLYLLHKLQEDLKGESHLISICVEDSTPSFLILPTILSLSIKLIHPLKYIQQDITKLILMCVVYNTLFYLVLCLVHF